MLGAKIAPPVVAHRRGLGGRVDDVREHDRREDAVEHLLLVSDDHADEPLDLLEQRVLVSRPRKVIAARELDVLRANDCSRQIAAGPNGLDQVFGPMKDECRNTDYRQKPPNIHLAEDPFLRVDPARTRRQALEPFPPEQDLLVAHQTRVDEGERRFGVLSGPPSGADFTEVVLPLPLGPLPRIVGRLAASGGRRVQDETRRALRMGRREHRAQRAGIGETEQHRAFRSDLVEHRCEIVDEVLQRR